MKQLVDDSDGCCGLNMDGSGRGDEKRSNSKCVLKVLLLL